MTGRSAAADAPNVSEHPLAQLVARDGSATHGHSRSLLTLDSAAATRNASDAIHHLSMLHGRYPGVIDHASARTADDGARRQMFALADAFAIERDFLGRLVVAAGPIPSTPGQAETESSVVAQRHAIEMLAQSERRGCSLGAAIGVALDWHGIRPVLEAAARRFGVDIAATTIISPDELTAIAARECTAPATDRAAAFGAQQIVTQHRGLWDLLQARAHARADN